MKVGYCGKCKLYKILTKHHHLTKRVATAMVEDNNNKPRISIKHFHKKRKKVRENGEIELLCRECHTEVHKI